jgi:glutathione S-transferase
MTGHLHLVPVNVLKGEPRQPELARHPFGKVPVLDQDGFRIIETGVIAPYPDQVLPGPSFTPDSSNDRGRMRKAIGIVDSHGCSALIAVAGYHLFPDFIGGADEKARKQAIVSSRRVLRELMKLRGASAVIAGECPLFGVFCRPDLLPRLIYPRCQRSLCEWMVSPGGGRRCG